MNSLQRINALCSSQLVKSSLRSMSKEIFPPSQEPEIPAYQEKVGESVELKKASDSSLGWSVDLDQQSPVYENIEEEPVLTSLVRQQYLKRLRQCLHENALRYDKSKDVGDAKSHVDKMAASLEKKALRSCMVAKLYIRSMLTIIGDIKNSSEPQIKIQIEQCPSSTSHHTPSLSSASHSHHKRSQMTTPNKVSTPNKSLTPSRQISISSNKERTEPPEHMVQMKIPTMDEIRAYEVRQSQDGANGQPFLSAEDLNDVSSILDSLPLDLELPSQAHCSLPNDSECLGPHTTPHLSLDQRLEQMKHVLPLSSSEDQSLEISSTNTAHDSLHKRKHDAIVSQYKAKKMLKVSRVAELANKRISEVVVEDEQSLFQQRVAMVFKLEQELQVLPLHRRTVLEKLFTRLFGPGHNYYLELSDEKQSDITRKRIASLVVAELEPYYAGEPKRIANKNLFKYLAKYLTELVYTINVCPDAIEVHERVAEFFMNGRTVTCESDIFTDD